jgi:hypothetical protein
VCRTATRRPECLPGLFVQVMKLRRVDSDFLRVPQLGFGLLILCQVGVCTAQSCRRRDSGRQTAPWAGGGRDRTGVIAGSRGPRSYDRCMADSAGGYVAVTRRLWDEHMAVRRTPTPPVMCWVIRGGCLSAAHGPSSICLLLEFGGVSVAHNRDLGCGTVDFGKIAAGAAGPRFPRGGRRRGG